MEMNITGICETSWEGSGHFNIQGNTVVYNGGKKAQGGVAVVLEQHTSKSLLSHDCVSERTLTVTLDKNLSKPPSSKFMPQPLSTRNL